MRKRGISYGKKREENECEKGLKITRGKPKKRKGKPYKEESKTEIR